jgi:hypothetical protein
MKSEELQGGTYLIKDGQRTLVEPPTADHPEGNCARDADGRPLGAGELPVPAAAPARRAIKTESNQGATDK